MMDSFETFLEGAGWALLSFVVISVVVVLIWLSPIGRFIDEFEEFRKWKRDRDK